MERSDTAEREGRTTRCLVIAVIVVLLILLVFRAGSGPGRLRLGETAQGLARAGWAALTRAHQGARPVQPGPAPAPAPAAARAPARDPRRIVQAERQSVREAMNRLYSTADVDPLVTGQLYAHNEQVRPIYAQRTAYPEDDLESLAIEQSSCRSAYGLTEYSSSWGPDSVGVDIGPYGLDEYSGLSGRYDDGLPPQYNLPSTPFRDYKPSQEDYYDPAGPEVYSVGLYALSVPDHDPLVG